MEEQTHVIPHHHLVRTEERFRLNGHTALTVWLTGLSGSGKSTIAGQLEQILIKNKIRCYILDGDNIRTGLNKGLTFTKEDRKENLRRIAEVSKLFMDAGVVVLSAFIAPLRKDREMVKKIIGAEHYIEVFVNTSLDECERRDVKGLYKKARKGEISNFTGLTAPYEIPEQPEINISTAKEQIEDSAQRIFDYLMNEKKLMEL